MPTEPQKKPRRQKYVIDYVYGFRGEVTHNAHFNAKNQVVYATAALGVILDTTTNTQRFFGGGETSGKSRTVVNDTSFHTDHISAIAFSVDRRFAVTGQAGAAPTIFIWDTVKGRKSKRF